MKHYAMVPLDPSCLKLRGELFENLDASACIQTHSLPATASDYYKALYFSRDMTEHCNAAFVDTEVTSALGRLVLGGISSVRDIVNAEHALAALIFHEEVHRVVPAYKTAWAPSDLLVYTRPQNADLNLPCAELWARCGAKDHLVALECVAVDNDVVTRETCRFFSLKDASAVEIINASNISPKIFGEAVLRICGDLHVPLYSSFEMNPDLRVFLPSFGYAKFRELHRSQTERTVDLAIGVHVPFLTHLVLYRAKNRENIVEAVAELREDLSDLRRRLFDMHIALIASTTQSDAERIISNLEREVRTVFDYAKLPDVELRRNKIKRMVRFCNPLLKWVTSDNVKELPETVGQVISTYGQDVLQDVVLDPQGPYGGLAHDMRNIDTIWNLVEHHFSHAEVSAIRRSAKGW